MQQDAPAHNSGDVKKQEKRKPPRPEFSASDIPGALVLIVVVFLIAVIYVAHYYVNEHSDGLKFGTEATFSFLALIVVTAQAIIYAQQAGFMKKQWEAMAQQVRLMTISESAYVVVDEFQPPVFREHAIEIEGKMFNRGRTPAFEFQRILQVAMGEGQPPKGWGRFDWNASPYEVESLLIPAGGNVNFGMLLPNVSKEDMQSFKDGDKVVVVDGQCRYLDNLGELLIYTFGITFQFDSMKRLRPLMRYQHYRREEKADRNPN